MINSSPLASSVALLSRLHSFLLGLTESLQWLARPSTKPPIPASVVITDHTYLDILNDFEPDDDSTQMWLDFIASDPDAQAATVDFLELCLEHE